MKSWKLIKPNSLKFFNEEPSELNEIKNVKVKMDKVLIAHNDILLYNNLAAALPDMILGSIGVGVVSEVLNSEEARFSRMDRVVIEPYLACGNCRFCKEAEYLMCTKKQQLGVNADGLLQDFISLPQKCLYGVPEALSSTNALLAPIVSMALNIIDKINLEKGDHVAIFGGGKLGIVLACIINYYQAVPIFVTSNADMQQISTQKNIFYTFSDNEKTNEEIFAATGGRLCEKVVYLCDGSNNIEKSIDACGINAIFCVGGSINTKCNLNLQFIQDKNITVNSVDNCYGNFPSALNLLTNGLIKAEDFACEELSFADLDKTIKNINEEQPLYQNIIINFE